MNGLFCDVEVCEDGQGVRVVDPTKVVVVDQLQVSVKAFLLKKAKTKFRKEKTDSRPIKSERCNI